MAISWPSTTNTTKPKCGSKPSSTPLYYHTSAVVEPVGGHVLAERAFLALSRTEWLPYMSSNNSTKDINIWNGKIKVSIR